LEWNFKKDDGAGKVGDGGGEGEFILTL